MAKPQYIRVNGHLYKRADEGSLYVVTVSKEGKPEDVVWITPDENIATNEIQTKFYRDPDYDFDVEQVARSAFKEDWLESLEENEFKQRGFAKVPPSTYKALLKPNGATGTQPPAKKKQSPFQELVSGSKAYSELPNQLKEMRYTLSTILRMAESRGLLSGDTVDGETVLKTDNVTRLLGAAAELMNGYTFQAKQQLGMVLRDIDKFSN